MKRASTGGMANWHGVALELQLGVQFCVDILTGEASGLAPGAVRSVQLQAPELVDDLVIEFETGARWAIQAKAGSSVRVVWSGDRPFGNALRRLYNGATSGQIDLSAGSLDRLELAVDHLAPSSVTAFGNWLVKARSYDEWARFVAAAASSREAEWATRLPDFLGTEPGDLVLTFLKKLYVRRVPPPDEWWSHLRGRLIVAGVPDGETADRILALIVAQVADAASYSRVLHAEDLIRACAGVPGLPRPTPPPFRIFLQPAEDDLYAALHMPPIRLDRFVPRPELDAALATKQGILVAGRPGSGKSHALIKLALSRPNWPAVVVARHFCPDDLGRLDAILRRLHGPYHLLWDDVHDKPDLFVDAVQRLAGRGHEVRVLAAYRVQYEASVLKRVTPDFCWRLGIQANGLRLQPFDAHQAMEMVSAVAAVLELELSLVDRQDYVARVQEDDGGPLLALAIGLLLRERKDAGHQVRVTDVIQAAELVAKDWPPDFHEVHNPYRAEDSTPAFQRPTIAATTHTLPLDQLSPRDFERLCSWLVEAEGYEGIEQLGAAGSEQGRELIAWRDGKLWIFQCKQAQNLDAASVKDEADKVARLPEDERPAGLIFVMTRDMSARARGEAQNYCAKAGMECDFWTGRELDQMIKRHSNIMSEFFELLSKDRDDELRNYIGRVAAACEARVYGLLARQPAAPMQPYKSLLTFEPNDEHIFFGRDTATQALYKTIVRDRLTVLHAKSGEGKTSLLNAGISPRLIREGYLAICTRTYDDPVQAIKNAIAPPSLGPIPYLLPQLTLREFLRLICRGLSPQTQGLVLILDQFEQFFIHWPERDQRQPFIDALADCYEDNELPVRFVIGIRKDYYSDLDDFRQRMPTVFHNEYRLGAMTREEAEVAITGPLGRLHHRVTYQPALLDVLLDDLMTGGLELPHLQIVCTRLYEGLAAGETTITLDAYEELGQAKAILRRYLEEILAQLPGREADLAKAALAELVASQITKRGLSHEELVARVEAKDSELVDALALLMNTGILRRNTIAGGIVYDISHPIVIDMAREWLGCVEEEYQARYRAVVRDAQRLLAQGDYLEARRKFATIMESYPHEAGRWRNELGFAFRFDAEEGEDRKIWDRNAGQLQWRRKVWAILSLGEKGYEYLDRAKDLEPDDLPYEHVDESEHRSGFTEAAAASLKAEAKGEALELATVDLLRLLFHLEDEDEQRILDELAQQPRGSQLGFDIKATICQTDANRQVRCLIECKGQDRNITTGTIADKLAEAKYYHSSIDHWILIAPRAHISSALKPLLDAWEDSGEYPFKVQVWCKDTEVHQLFGLSPILYNAWIDHPEGDEHPSHWSRVRKDRILDHWRRKLDPPLRLPKGWDTYVRDVKNLRVYSDESAEALERLVDDHLETRGLDETGSPLPGALADAIRDWLETGTSRILLLLGDFGDGKTVFTYLLSRMLLEEFRANPRAAWLPVRFSLRDFSLRGIDGARDFLRRRIEEFGADVASWKDLVEGHRVLVVLDGIDEMTKALDAHSVREALDLLLDCCTQEFKDQKLMLTCRTPFFGALAEREFLLDRLENPRTIRLTNVEKHTVLRHLATQATSPEERRRLRSLQFMHDPIGLATKPLFYNMISEAILDAKHPPTTQVDLYRDYVCRCLRRKSELLESESLRRAHPRLADSMMEILEMIALEIHCGEKEYADLKRLTRTDGEFVYARLLWETAHALEHTEEDARSRVGVRSLLRIVDPGDDSTDGDVWPVDFCHRSMREYFVARRVVALIREDVVTACKVLSEVDLGHEIVEFAAEMIRQSKGDDLHGELRYLAEKSRVVRDPEQKKRLGRNAIMLLYRSEGELREDDWSHMQFDGANLAGVNLTGKNFSGTSLRNAVLDNAVFVDANFGSADLTGVRLEETAEVRSIAVPSTQDRFYASYDDGSIRQWRFTTTAERPSQLVFQASVEGGRRPEITAMPGQGLTLYTKGYLVYADYNRDGYHEVAAFAIRPDIVRAVLKEQSVLLVLERPDREYVAQLYSIREDGSEIVHTRTLGASWLADSLGARAIIVVRPHGKLAIIPFEQDEEHELVIEGIGEPSALAVQGPVDDEGNIFVFALGDQGGAVGVWECRLKDGEPVVRELDRRQIHSEAVSSVVFVGDQALLTGGNDCRIFCLELGDEYTEPSVSPPYKLELQCQGMQIDGLESEKEREILRKVIG